VPAELNTEITHEFERLIRPRRVCGSTPLYRVGDRFTALYAIRSGSCKTIARSPDGLEQVVGYHIAGEILGSDGIDAGVHACEAVALEDTDVCALPFQKMEELACKYVSFQHNLSRQLAHEVARVHTLMLLLGSMRSEQRLVAFLLDLAARYQALGYSACEFTLRLTRKEIGSLLGLKLETVSRLFSYLHREGMIQLQGRVVKLLDRTALQRLMARD
jgi:CRP/FNR family transcriptional regulator